MHLASSYARYLRLLGFDSVPAGLDGLRALVRAHLVRVPFENVSKLLLFRREGAGRVTTLPEFLDGIEHHDLGGTCYTNNPYLAELLCAIGYDAALLGADLSSPNVQTSIRVSIDSVEYHVDVGFAAPLYEPIPLNRLPYETRRGSFRYIFSSDSEPTRYELRVCNANESILRYVVHGPPRPLDCFRQTIEKSYLPGKTFMTWLRIGRFFEGYSVDLVDRKLTIHRGSESNDYVMNSIREIRAAVSDELGMPRCSVEEAIEFLEELNGKRFFG